MSVAVKTSKSAFMGSLLLASGTSIGAGMLALPVLTGLVGFWPACFVYFVSWLVITFSSLLFLETTLSMPKEAHILSMARTTLGKSGQSFAFMVYIFLFYSVSVAYLSGSGSLMSDFFKSLFGYPLPRVLGITLSLALFGPSVYFGTHFVTKLNSLLATGIAVSYIFLILMGAKLVNPSNFSHIDLSYLWMGLPVIVTSFTFQNVIPTLSTYLKRDVSSLKSLMWLSGLIPLLIYIVWQWFVMGIIPLKGDFSLTQMLQNGLPISHALKYRLGSPIVISWSQIFAFCAIMTSFLGVILSLFDFMADGLKIEKKGMGKILLCGLIFIPPWLLAVLFPKAFLSALNYAGSFGCVSLFMILPALMAWKNRYQLNRERPYQVAGGKVSLIALSGLGFAIMLVQLLLTFGFLKSC